MIARGRISFNEFNVSDAEILSFYLGITHIPCVIKSPLRQDSNPSLGLFSPDGARINFIDFGTKDSGGTVTLMSKIWGIDVVETKEKIRKEINNSIDIPRINKTKPSSTVTITATSETNLECKVRDWENYDLEYWKSYGISIKWLKYAEVYPISHKIVTKGNHSYTFKADKYAYAYVEHKEGKVTLKIYQPFNKQWKWANKHDKSVISLWTKVPEYGEQICICSSLKDALCLWANTNIPSVAIQGEGYNMSSTAINELKRRYKRIYILFDNDDAGIKDGKKLAELTGFTNIVLPKFKEGKDISDLMKAKGKEAFLKIILPLFIN